MVLNPFFKCKMEVEVILPRSLTTQYYLGKSLLQNYLHGEHNQNMSRGLPMTVKPFGGAEKALERCKAIRKTKILNIEQNLQNSQLLRQYVMILMYNKSEINGLIYCERSSKIDCL